VHASLGRRSCLAFCRRGAASKNLDGFTHVPPLTGIRGSAILLVLVYHLPRSNPVIDSPIPTSGRRSMAQPTVMSPSPSRSPASSSRAPCGTRWMPRATSSLLRAEIAAHLPALLRFPAAAVPAQPPAPLFVVGIAVFLPQRSILDGRPPAPRIVIHHNQDQPQGRRDPSEGSCASTASSPIPCRCPAPPARPGHARGLVGSYCAATLPLQRPKMADVEKAELEWDLHAPKRSWRPGDTV
jgi:hypothetical protein